MDVFLAICQGLGLALAAGIGGMLAVLLMSVIAHVDIGWDLDGTDFEWFEAAWFIPILFALNVVAFLHARGSLPRQAGRGALLGLIAVFGAIVFAGSIAEETSTWWPGLAAGAALATLSFLLTDDFVTGATARSEETAGTLTLMVAGAGVLLVIASVLVPPISLAAAAGVAALAAGRRRRAEQKYEGLRSLR